MGIRYYARNIGSIYYATDGYLTIVIAYHGYFLTDFSTLSEEWLEKNGSYQEIEEPSSYPIEERYINATDNPYVDGFKYSVILEGVDCGA